jgi:hypothetical protein
MLTCAIATCIPRRRILESARAAGCRRTSARTELVSSCVHTPHGRIAGFFDFALTPRRLSSTLCGIRAQLTLESGYSTRWPRYVPTPIGVNTRPVV